MLFFSDAIFAIAITLLVIDIRVPDLPAARLNVGHELGVAAPRILGFGISFAVIGLFWMGHHSVFRFITTLDRALIAMNLLFLGMIAFLPYPTALLSASRQQASATIFYALCIAAAGLAEFAIWLYAALIRDLVVPGLPADMRRYIALRILRIPVVFLLSIPVAIVAPGVAAYFWILVSFLGFALHRLRPNDEPAEPES